MQTTHYFLLAVVFLLPVCYLFPEQLYLSLETSWFSFVELCLGIQRIDLWLAINVVPWLIGILVVLPAMMLAVKALVKCLIQCPDTWRSARNPFE